MIPGLNPREMQKAMKRLGIKQEEIDAQEVIIRTSDKNIIIKNPHVSKVNMMGQETFQVSGEITEIESNDIEINEDDIATVIDQTSCTREEALEALEQSSGNIAEAILKLQNK
jgi:nascent polypeptide-associated complex subunit alpha